MRPCPVNSPATAARILSLTLLADQRLGMGRSALQAVLHTCGRDVAHIAQLNLTEACALDPRTLQQVLFEVSDIVLRRHVLALCVAAVEADEHASGGEHTLLTAAAEQWGAPPVPPR
jgi:hypothetical protein